MFGFCLSVLKQMTDAVDSDSTDCILVMDEELDFPAQMTVHMLKPIVVQEK